MINRVKTDKEIAAMRDSGRMLATVLQRLSRSLVPGVTTQQLADVAAQETQKLGGQPAFLDYQGFPDVLCVSINDEVVHGIPGRRVIQNGDIVGLDFGVTYHGMITDAAVTLIAGHSSNKKVHRLVKTTQQALNQGIAAIKDGVHIGDVSAAIQTVLDSGGLGVIRDLVGHGVGHYLHEEPNVPNFGAPGSGPTLKTGMTIAIEPMATLGDYHVYLSQDGWTVHTRDGSLAAHFEHTVLVTDSGAEILTTL